MLLAMARESDERLTREAIHNRTHGGLDRPDEIDVKAVLGEAAIGFVYKFIATRGSRTRVDEADEATMVDILGAWAGPRLLRAFPGRG